MQYDKHFRSRKVTALLIAIRVRIIFALISNPHWRKSYCGYDDFFSYFIFQMAFKQRISFRALANFPPSPPVPILSLILQNLARAAGPISGGVI